MTALSLDKTAGSPSETIVEGLVLKTQSGFSTVLTDDGDRILVNLAKKVKQGGRTSTAAVVIGDRVRVRNSGDEGATGTVEAVLERRNQLCRLAPGRRSMKDVLAANLDSFVIVESLRRPDFNPLRLDRFLAIGEHADIPSSIVLNKSDLAPREESEQIAAAYVRAGYPVIFCSAKAGVGVEAVWDHFHGISVMIGPSGVGKSTILNHLKPGLRLRTGEVSESTSKGRHTTVTAELLLLRDGVYVADTPGLRSVGLTDLDRYEVASLFRELRPLIGACKFPDCLHIDEPGCAVRLAREDGRFSAARYESYKRVLQHVIDGYIEDWDLG